MNYAMVKVLHLNWKVSLPFELLQEGTDYCDYDTGIWLHYLMV